MPSSVAFVQRPVHTKKGPFQARSDPRRSPPHAQPQYDVKFAATFDFLACKSLRVRQRIGVANREEEEEEEEEEEQQQRSTHWPGRPPRGPSSRGAPLSATDRTHRR